MVHLFSKEKKEKKRKREDYLIRLNYTLKERNRKKQKDET